MNKIIQIPQNEYLRYKPVLFSAIQNPESKMLTHINIDLIKIESFLYNESSISFEARIIRMNQNNFIPLDATVLDELIKRPDLIPENWKQKVDDCTLFVCFDGTVLVGTNGSRFIYRLFWDEKNWDKDKFFLDGNNFCKSHPSAVIHRSFVKRGS